jgi:hypothetical protein
MPSLDTVTDVQMNALSQQVESLLSAAVTGVDALLDKWTVLLASQ